MKLYYWPEVSALADWMPGKVFAIASSVEEARRVVREKDASTAPWDWKSVADECDATEPDVYDVPTAVFVYGSA